MILWTRMRLSASWTRSCKYTVLTSTDVMSKIAAIDKPHSSSGLGHGPLKAETRVRNPYGVPNEFQSEHEPVALSLLVFGFPPISSPPLVPDLPLIFCKYANGGELYFPLIPITRIGVIFHKYRE